MKIVCKTIPLLLLLTGNCFAQYRPGLNIDSLKLLIRDHPDDTAKALNYIWLGQQYENISADTSIYFYKKAGELSQRLHDPHGVIRFINNYTAILNTTGRQEAALKENLRAVKIAENEKFKDELLMAEINTAVTFQQMENYAEALSWYQRAKPKLEKLEDPARLAVVYGNMCGLYRNLRHYEKALPLAQIALANAEKSKDPSIIGSANSNLANSLKDFGKFDEAIVMLQKAVKLAKSTGNTSAEETALINLADCYLQLEQPEKYTPLYEQALKLAEELGDASGESYARLGISLSDYWNKRYQTAEAELKDAIVFSTKYHQQEPLARMLLLMSDIQIALGKPGLANPYRNKYDSIRQNLTGIDLQKNIQELETKYETAVKEKQLLEQRQWLLAAGATVSGLILLLIAGVLVFRQRQKLNRRAMQAAEAEKETIRLKSALEGEQLERKRISQEMHDDMGSGLTRMLFLSRRLNKTDENAVKISEAAQGLVTKMNEIIWMMSEREINLAGLFDQINRTTREQLEAAGIEYIYELHNPLPDINTDQDFRRNIFLVVKEIIHNAVKHSAASIVTLEVWGGEFMKIVIRDNGKGLIKNHNNNGNGILNMKERIAKINGTIEIKNDDGTAITILAPLNS